MAQHLKIISNQLGENQLNKIIEQNNYDGMSKTESHEFKEKLKKLNDSGFVFNLDFIIYVLLGILHNVGSKMEKPYKKHTIPIFK